MMSNSDANMQNDNVFLDPEEELISSSNRQPISSARDSPPGSGNNSLVSNSAGSQSALSHSLQQEDSGYSTLPPSANSSRLIDSPYSNTSQPSVSHNFSSAGAVETEDELVDTMFMISMEDLPGHSQPQAVYQAQFPRHLLSSPVERFSHSPPATALRPTASGGEGQRFFPPSTIGAAPFRAVSPHYPNRMSTTQTFAAAAFGTSWTRGSSYSRPSSAPIYGDSIDDIIEDPCEEDSDSDTDTELTDDEDIHNLHYSRQSTLEHSASAPTAAHFSQNLLQLPQNLLPQPPQLPMPDVVQTHPAPAALPGPQHRCQSVPVLGIGREQLLNIQNIGLHLREVGDAFHPQFSGRDLPTSRGASAAPATSDAASAANRNRRFSVPSFSSLTSSLTSLALSPAVSLLDLIGSVVVGDSRPAVPSPAPAAGGQQHQLRRSSVAAIRRTSTAAASGSHRQRRASEIVPSNEEEREQAWPFPIPKSWKK